MPTFHQSLLDVGVEIAEDGAMAVVVLPEEPRDPRDRLLNRVLFVAVGVVAVLLVYSLLDAYVF